MKNLILFFTTALASDVITLTTANFDDTIKENKNILVEFYAPWCGHCKQLAPEFEKAAAKLKGKVALGMVDATVESELGSRFEVQGYPTLKWFVNGEPSEYDGGRSEATIVEWCEAMTGPAIKEVESEDKIEKADGKPTIILFGKVTEAYDEVAQSMRKEAQWINIPTGDAKIVMQHPGEDKLELTKVDDQDAIKEFVKNNKLPMFGALDGNTFSQYMASEQGLIWSLFKMEKDEMQKVADENREMMMEVAKATVGKFKVTYTDTVAFKDAIESMLGVTEFNKIALQKKAGDKKKFIYDGEMTAANIKTWIADIEAGKIVAKLKSEAVPAEQGAVTVVVGDNLEKECFTKGKDVLLEIYAPWCGHCKKLDPEWEKVGKKVQKEGLADYFTIAKMDGTQNDSPDERIDWSGFPTIYHIQDGGEPKKYEGARDAKGIWKYLKKESMNADKIAEIIKANKEKKDDGKEEL